MNISNYDPNIFGIILIYSLLNTMESNTLYHSLNIMHTDLRIKIFLKNLSLYL